MERGGGLDGETEQRLIYLRQAFVAFFRAKQGVEMQNLARVICAILGIVEEQAQIMERGGGLDGETEQRLIYLRQAFVAFFRAKQGVEMQNLARVICAILGIVEEQAQIMESIARLSTALVATSTLESLSYNFSNLFS
eukprot:CAMPEP_0173222944 /NCGR_PEP_ID=MMETSP1142-20121109/3523_1 /TAXON_ID=483371 /ORGANISM="non described non described, Strain CCMP2298" /LENGTH=137 /DNA_ID=CAMNT_0014151073 /DNA_START=18 /DNA_END=431 /DNA_ORIENTATION=+